MKNIKKLTSLLLVAVMLFAMSATAFAAQANLTGHTYKAYQIFTGTQAEGKAELASIDWGEGVDGAALLTALKEDPTIGSDFTSCESAADVADVLAGYKDDSVQAEAFAKLAYANKVGVGVNTGTTLDAGYYLVVDVTKFEEGAENTVYNLALLQLTNAGEFEIRNKTEIPTVVKKVDDVNDSDATVDGAPDEVKWQDSADYDLGDAVPFQLTGTLPSDFDTYVKYKYIFHDTLAEGLTYNRDLKVWLVNGDDKTDITSSFTTTAPTTDFGGELVAACANLKGITGVTATSKIVVEYTALLNEKAKLGYVGNKNEVYLEYSNDPNAGGEGEPTGKTPVDTVIVFTYKVNVDKYKQSVAEGNELSGAGFTLYKEVAAGTEGAKTGKEIKAAFDENVKADALKDNSYYIEIAATTVDKAGDTFGFERIDDGKYVLVETKIPAGYNAWDSQEFTISATHDPEADEPTLKELEGGNLFTGEVTTGTLDTDIVNNAGTTLPETGGVGTTMFYVIGAILMVGAAVVMITRKRMSR